MHMLYFLFTDETNKDPSEESEFFIYGGLIVSADKLTELHSRIASIRERHGYRPGDRFKFTTKGRPGHVTSEQHRLAKKAVLQDCSELGIKLAAYVVLHEIARKRMEKELIGWGANAIAVEFDRFLEEQDSTGICVVDRYQGDFEYLQEKFEAGLRRENGQTTRSDRILAFASSCDGASHAMSAIDIILGAFRYCVNDRDRGSAAREMFPMVARMLWQRWTGSKTSHSGMFATLFWPRRVRSPKYQRAYAELDEHLEVLAGEGREEYDEEQYGWEGMIPFWRAGSGGNQQGQPS